jgi:taurine dioxygenase
MTIKLSAIASNTAQDVNITPLDAPLGAVVTGLDASKAIDPATILRLKQAHRNYHILIFKNQKLTDEQLKDFAYYFGDLFVPLDETPVLASKVGFTPVVIPVANIEGGYTGTGELSFHIDHKWTPSPSSGSFLYAEEVTTKGGETAWLNLNLAYEALDGATKERIKDLQLNTYNPFLRKPDSPKRLYRSDRTIPPISPVYPHPLVRTHPESGLKLLNLDYATEVEVVGLEPEEGSELIAKLREHLNQPKFYYEHKWSVGDIVYWDNQSTLHRRTAFAPSERRVLKRISLAGSRPF